MRIQGCDLDHGYLCGTMEALNVPMADTPVRTHLNHCDFFFVLSEDCGCSIGYYGMSSHTIRSSGWYPEFIQYIIVSSSQVVTFWEGEIVDTKNYTFFTGKWGATYV